MAAILRAFWRATRGATSIEYAIIAFIVSIGIVAGARVIGTSLATRDFTPIASNLS